MFTQMKIGTRFIVSSGIAIVVVMLVTFSIVFNYVSDELKHAEKNVALELAENILNEIRTEGLRAQSMAAVVASITEVRKAFAEGDRQRLEELFAAGFEELKTQYGARQFQFHTPPATSFLRIHKIGKYGDDLSSFRFTVVETNKQQKPIKGLETGRFGLGVRGIVPVSFEGRHVGSVEFGLSFGQAFMDRIAALHDMDLSLDVWREGALEEFASTFADKDLLSMDTKKAVIGAEPAYIQSHDGQGPVGIYITEVASFNGETAGVLAISVDRSGSAEALNHLWQIIVIMGVVATLILVGLIGFVSKGVVKPLKKAAASMHEIAYGSGSLSDRLDESSNDELGDLAKGYNAFVTKIEQTVNDITATSNDLALMVSEFASLAEHTNRGITRQKDQSTQVATAMTEMSATVQEVAQNTTNTAQAATEADKQSYAGQEIVKTAMESINRLASEVEQASANVKQVEEDSERIGSVLDVIRGIAEQTNLLALNAAIEAARAGEQGRGFAVVADEVRNLASRTQESTEEIQEMISSLQSGVSSTVTIMQTSHQQATQSVDHAAQAHQALVSITQSIDTITSMSSQIATAAEEQSAVAEEINRNIVDITDVAHQTADDALKTTEATDHLASDVEKLVGLMAGFKTSNLKNELRQAKSSHLAWKGKLVSFLEGRGSIDEGVAFSHHQCVFGKWYDNAGLKQFGHKQAMRDLEKPHRELHETIKQVVEAKKRGDMAAVDREMAKIDPLSQQVVELIDQLLKD